MKYRKSAAAVSGFLRQQYGISWPEISSKMRATLLEEVQSVPCNLCGRDESVPVAGRDKYLLPLTTVMCRGCGLLYLNPRPTAETYRKFYEQGGQQDSVYHRSVNFNSVPDLLKVYYGPDFEMDDAARAAMIRFMADNEIGWDAKSLGTAAPAESAGEPDDESPDEPKPVGNTPTTADKALDYYGVHLYEQLKDLVPVGGKVFEPGASWGKMLYPWKALHGCEVSGVEPKKQSVIAAKERLGIDLIQGFSDDPRIPENHYDLVINTRTINHMLDPLGDLGKAWRWLKPGGLLFVDIADAIREARYEGFERSVIEIDHAYMFSLNTLSAMVQKAGFVIVKREHQDLQHVRDWDNRPAQTKQIRIVARKTTESPSIDWPDPVVELANLLQSQLQFDREQDDRIEKLQRRVKEKKTRKKLKARKASQPGRPAEVDRKVDQRGLTSLPTRLLSSLLKRRKPDKKKKKGAG
jgi:SAM-dependent methyltransferase